MAESITFPAPVNPSDPGTGPVIMGITWTLTILCLICIATRFYLRSAVSHSLASDDAFMLVAGVFQLFFQACISRAYRWGLGKHDEDLEFVPEAINTLKWVWISTTFGILVSIVARISITILLTRIFGVHKPLKWFLNIFTVLQSTVAVVLIIFVWVQVKPAAGLWDPRVIATRWDPRIQQYTAYLTQSLFTFSDLTYVLFPVMVVWSLNMPLRRKVALIILMGFSLFTMGASIMKTITAQSNSSTNNAVYNVGVATLWASIEQSFVIIMGCVPVLRSIVKVKGIQNIGVSLASLAGRFTPRSVSLKRWRKHDEEMNSLKQSNGTGGSRDFS